MSDNLLDEWQSRSGEKLGTTDWLLIDQQRIDQFADVTLDHQSIHVDADAVASQAMGGTIAHGFLTLSLLSHFSAQLTAPLTGNRTVLNYGLNRVRFLTPVPSGCKIRMHMTVQSAEQKPRGVLLTYLAEIEIQHHDKPAMVAEQLALILE